MSQHTKGPWQVLPDVNRNRDSARIFAGSKFIGIIGNSDDTHEQTYSNAYLIAAAPELLEALERFVGGDRTGVENIDYLFAVQAIAKAKGEA